MGIDLRNAGDGEYLTTKEVCDFLKVGKFTLYHYLRIGLITGQKLGKHWRISRHQIVETTPSGVRL